MAEDDISKKRPLESTDKENISEKEQFIQDIKKTVANSEHTTPSDLNLSNDKPEIATKQAAGDYKPQSPGSDGKDTVFKRFHKLSRDEEKKKSNKYNDNVSTIIVIVYTVLLLVLGFLVYRDLSRRLDILENRVSRIETVVTEKKNLTLDNIEIYDVK